MIRIDFDTTIANTIYWVLFAANLGFYSACLVRQTAVKGSRGRAVFTNWAWLLLWLAYAYVGYWILVTFTEPVGLHIFIAAAHSFMTFCYHRQLRNDDEDNPWTKLKCKLQAGIKRLRSITIQTPQIIPPAMPHPGGA